MVWGLPNTYGFSMEGKGDVSKWNGLSPVMTNANPNNYQAYEWFAKDDKGRWISGDIGKTRDAKFAGTGNVPRQHIISDELARAFLSPDGKFWFPWRDISGEAVPKLNIFRTTFSSGTTDACVAMRVPYTYIYQQTMLAKLKAAKYPGVSIDEIGVTPDRRKLQVIRIDDPEHITPIKNTGDTLTFDGKHIPQYTFNDPPKNDMYGHRVILVMAGEHATEHASSWAIDGILRSLLTDTPEAAKLRKDTTWLLIPILDPDGRARSEFASLTNKFYNQRGDMPAINNTPTETIAYASYIRAFVNSGRVLTTAVTLHNVECNEGPVVYSPFGIAEAWEPTKALNNTYFTRLRAHGYKVGSDIPLEGGQQQMRFYGWCGMKFGALPFAFEVNDRYPSQRMTVKDLQDVGADLAYSLGDFRYSKEGLECLGRTEARLKLRVQERNTYLAKPINAEDSMESLLTYGY